ncbi:MAG: hypothetical protein FJ295_18265 [Planctomycetes bacterium]|nr:hypothetical protein [Planctomycetota bacterium]
MSFAFSLALASCFMTQGPCAAVRAADSELTRDELESLFQVGWPKTPKALVDSEKLLGELTASHKTDARLPYAFALIKLRQLKYADADKVLEELLDDHPQELSARRMQIWLHVSRRDFDRAINEVMKLAAILPKEDEAGEKSSPDDKTETAVGVLNEPRAETVIETARFMGRVFGFLEGPVANSNNQLVREEYMEKLLASLPPRQRAAFIEGRDAVSDKFLELTDRRAESLERAKTQQKEEKEQKLKDLGETKDEIGRQSEKLKEANDKLRSELKSQLDDLNRRDRPLANKFMQLDADATVMRRQLSGISADMVLLRGRLETEKDPIVRGQILTQLDLLGVRGTRIEADLDVTTRQAAGVASQRAQLQQQANAVQEQASQIADGQNREFDQLQRKQKSAEAQEKRLKKSSPTSDTPETRAKSTAVTSFVTYEPFPLEKERQRLLDSFPPQK